ncbi:MAG: zinc-dependent metalloprotease [Balneolales bacterium]
MIKTKSICLILCLSFFSGCSSTKMNAGQTSESGATAASPEDKDDSLSEYQKITDDAETEEGLFTIHRKDSKLYYEIPDQELNKEILLVTRIVKAQSGTGHGGQRLNNQIIRWVKSGEKILLRSVIYSSFSDTTRSIAIAVRSVSFEPIIASFDIKTTGTDSTSSIIDVTSLFTTDVPELSHRQHFGGRRVDASRSYIENVRAFPENIEVQNVLTMETNNNGQSTISTLLNHSMVKLNDTPMMPRVYDERIGYFSTRHVDYGRDDHRAEQRRYISRWRMEKQDPSSALSEPVKPIVFYVDRATPAYLHEYIIQGIEDWQPAFEQAGFKKAIIGKMAPTPEEDPDWSPEDARNSNIRWVPSTVSNARGPHVNDPRTGEIITSSIEMYHNVMNLLKNWYFIQASAVDEKARSLPFSNELMGRLVRYVVAHEVGHTLGLQHNMKASGTVPTDSLRSKTFTAKYGTTPSIMDYARMNYVAQPGDEASMFPIVSIYDKFAIEWGYKPIPGVNTPDEEKQELNKIASRQAGNPMLLFGSLSAVDPTQQREALGDNHVKSSRYGIANLKLIMEFLIESAGIEGENYSELRELYGQVLSQRDRYLGHVTSWVGGVRGENKVFGQEGPVFTPVGRERQIDAINFLMEEAFQTPSYLLDPQLLSLIEPTGSVQRVMSSQRLVLNALINEDRIARMTETEAMNGQEDVYPAGEMLADITLSIWSELSHDPVIIDLYRRNLQRTYLDVFRKRLQSSAVRGETRALLRGHLRNVEQLIDRHSGGISHTATLFHLNDMAYQIESLLNGD